MEFLQTDLISARTSGLFLWPPFTPVIPAKAGIS
jgi:hypothetical protein